MSSENIELVRRASEALSRRPPDWEVINDLVDPAHEFVPATPEGNAFTGAPGFRRWMQESDEVLAWQGEFDGAIEIGPRRVLSQMALRFRGASSEIEVDQRLWFVITVSEGKIVRTEAFTDPMGALSSGVSE